jgi:hypothetical protein
MVLGRILVAVLALAALEARASDLWPGAPHQRSDAGGGFAGGYFSEMRLKLVTGELAARDVPEGEVSAPAPVPAPGPRRCRLAAAVRSIFLPGFGQLYNGDRIKAGFVLGAEIALLGAALGFHLTGASALAASHETRPTEAVPDPAGRARALSDQAASRYRTRDSLLATATVVWAVNVADAYLSGRGSGLLDWGVAATERGLAPLAAIRPDGALVGVQGHF